MPRHLILDGVPELFLAILENNAAAITAYFEGIKSLSLDPQALREIENQLKINGFSVR